MNMTSACVMRTADHSKLLVLQLGRVLLQVPLIGKPLRMHFYLHGMTDGPPRSATQPIESTMRCSC
jgi:hypothetical protein